MPFGRIFAAGRRARLALTIGLAAALSSPAGANPEGAASQAGNQIRLNRPPGESGQPTLPSLGAPTAPAPSAPPAATITDISPQESLRLFQSAGFASVRLVEDAKGDYLRVRSGERDSFIFHMNCTDGRCRSLMFMAFLEGKRGASLNFVNGYNLKTLHTKMARNDAGEIALTMATSLTGGVTAQHLRALAPFWDQVHRDALAWK